MAKKELIYLADLSYFNKYTKPHITIPLNVGYIAAYALKFFAKEFDIKIFKDPRELVDNIHRNPPAILGLSCYTWNSRINILIAEIAKTRNTDTIVTVGGPEVDSYTEEQTSLHRQFSGYCDFYILNEGELGFYNLLKRYLEAGSKNLFREPIDGGIHFLDETNRLVGEYTGTSVELDDIPSPLLSGLLDDYLTSDYLPMIQTSRLCPYTCTFCYQGNIKGKVRAFELQRVYTEIDYIAERYKKFPHMRFHIIDDNFGILKRDRDVARYLYEARERVGYPKQIFVYFDKKFQTGSREAYSYLAEMSGEGVALAFQSLNKETLKAIKRVNLSDQQIDELIEWSREHKFMVSAQMIIGLPFETKKTFLEAVEYLIQKKVDNISMYQLFLLKGMDLNQRSERERFKFKTMWRPCYAPSYERFDSKFVCEAQEVVVSNPYFSFEDYLDINKINLMCYLLTTAEYFKRVITYLVDHTDIKITALFDNIMNSSNNIKVNNEHATFISDYYHGRIDELSETYEETKKKMQNLYEQEGEQIDSASRLNVLFAARLINTENWFGPLLLELINDYELDKMKKNIIRDLIKISEVERVNLRDPNQEAQVYISRETIPFINGHIENSRVLDDNYEHFQLRLSSSSSQKLLIESFNEGFSQLDAVSYYYNALNFITPRSKLRFEVLTLDPVLNRPMPLKSRISHDFSGTIRIDHKQES